MNVTSDNFCKKLNHIACEIDEVKPACFTHIILSAEGWCGFHIRYFWDLQITKSKLD